MMKTDQTLKQDFADTLDGMALFASDSIGNVEYLDNSTVAGELIETLVNRMQLQGLSESIIDAVLGDRDD